MTWKKQNNNGATLLKQDKAGVSWKKQDNNGATCPQFQTRMHFNRLRDAISDTDAFLIDTERDAISDRDAFVTDTGEARRGATNEYPQHMFLWRNNQNYPLIVTKYPPYLFYCKLLAALPKGI